MNHIEKIIEDIPIYYINLNRSLDRKEKMEKILGDNNLKYKRIEAIDGRDLNLEEIKKNYLVNPKLNIFEIACALSHMKVIEEIINDGHEYALVFEDDCNFEYLKYKKEKLKDLIKSNNKWEIIQLGSINNKKNFEIISNSQDKLIEINDAGAHSYLINKKGAFKIMENFKNNKKIEVSEYLLFKTCNCYCTKPYFTYFNYKEVGSTIRENTKSAFTTQRLSKMWWDEYYEKNKD
jgi:GR25 family glycosyltransferase involved in LPS biosynthesis